MTRLASQAESFSRLCLGLILLFCTFSLSAQPAVVELGANNQQRNQAPAPAAQEGSNRIMMDLYMQLQALQQEVQMLRGMMEEQEHRVRQMEAQQRDRYLDIDRRLSELTTGGQGQGGAASAAVPAPGSANQANNASAPGLAGSGLPVVVDSPVVQQEPMSEQDTYRNALSLLLDESDYEGSIRLFQRYIDEYPRGSFLTNAYYWQGEALILVQRYTQALNMFNRLLEDYPDDPKAPGALLKMGVIHSQSGDRARAEEAWRSISRIYPDSATEIRAAEDYLRRN